MQKIINKTDATGTWNQFCFTKNLLVLFNYDLFILYKNSALWSFSVNDKL